MSDTKNNETVATAQNVDLTIYARKYTRKAMKVLAGIMEDPTAPATARIAAAKELLSRGHGQAPQRLNVVRQLGDNELELLAKAIIEKRKAALQAPSQVIDMPPIQDDPEQDT